MEEKQYIKVIGKQVDQKGNVLAKATAMIPYIKGEAIDLPNVAPFNTNVMLDGDTGVPGNCWMRWGIS